MADPPSDIGEFVIGESRIYGNPYPALITSEHADKPKFVQTVVISTQGFFDQQQVLRSIPGLYDLDAAVGVQLDVVGQWVNRNRFAPDALGDDAYRILLRGAIAANHWDGSIPGAYAAWDILFSSEGMFILIFDHEDMSMAIALAGAVPDAETIALLTGGYLSLKPEGVRITDYSYPTEPGGPLAAFDIETAYLAGFDVGVWSTQVMA